MWLDLSSGRESQPQPRQTAQNKDPTSERSTCKEGADHRGEQGGKSESQSPLTLMSQEVSHNSSPTSQDAAHGCSLSSSPLSTPSSSAAPSRSPSSTSGLSSGFLPSPSQSTKAIHGLLGTTKRTAPLQSSTKAHSEFFILQVQHPSSVTSRAQWCTGTHTSRICAAWTSLHRASVTAFVSTASERRCPSPSQGARSPSLK